MNRKNLNHPDIMNIHTKEEMMEHIMDEYGGAILKLMFVIVRSLKI
ncbi:hypothetical protein ACJROX_13155 [Pseudalkalibacillus sp. A8]